jgi:cell division protein FtsW
MEEIKEPKPDYFLILTVIIISILGLIILASSSAFLSQKRFGEPFYYLKRQIFFGFLPGIFLSFLISKLKIDYLKRWSLRLFLINIILLGLVFIPGLGLKIGGATRWLNLRVISFQPSEFLKLTFILYLGSWLESRKRKEEKKFESSFWAFLIITSILGIILILQPDASTLLVILITATLMYFLAETPLIHSILIIFFLFLVGIGLIFGAQYRINRILVFLNPNLDPLGLGYHLQQSLIAVGSGGIFGSGLGFSEQKKSYLPGVVSDAIFSVFAEETGFLGSLFLIFFYLIFFWRGFKIGIEAKDLFSKLVAFGISFWIVFQAFFNIGAMIGIFPLTGIPLPFISYGGSAIISQLVGVGILLSISKLK